MVNRDQEEIAKYAGCRQVYTIDHIEKSQTKPKRIGKRKLFFNDVSEQLEQWKCSQIS